MFEVKDLILTKGIAATPKFSSTAERIEFFADIASESFDIEYRYFAYDAEGAKKQIGAGVAVFSGKFFHIKSDFDPVYFGVYGGAESFKVEFFSRSGSEIEIKAFALAEKTNLREDVLQDDESVETVYSIPSKVLFIGNSLLLGMFGKYGMCASAPDKDYYHYVTEYIKEQNPSCSFSKLHGAGFEGLPSPDAFEEWFYRTENPHTGRPAADSFVEDIDLLFVQLGDNINTEEKEEVFKKTAFLLADEIKKRCPRAQIIWIYGWYNWDRTFETVKTVKEKYSIEIIDIEFLMIPKNHAKLGQISVGPDGEPVVVKDHWITHPGDEGFKEIAQKIIKKLNFK